jgi:ribosomal protein S6--L-glutamate ligase
MASSLRAEGFETRIFSAGDITHDVSAGRVELRGDDLSTLAGIVVKKLGDQSNPWSRLRLHALRVLEKRGVRVFSRPDVIDRVMDRYRMTVDLAAAGLPIPATIVAESEARIRTATAQLGDSVVKPVYTSKGRGMVRVRGELPARFTGTASHQRYLVQKFVEAPGRDIGATVIGGRFAGAFFRMAAQGEWMTTTSQGGRYAPCDLTPEGVELAERVAHLFGLDYTVIDLVEHEGGYLIYEASAFGGFRGLLEATGIDPSVEYAAHIRRELAG